MGREARRLPLPKGRVPVPEPKIFKGDLPGTLTYAYPDGRTETIGIDYKPEDYQRARQIADATGDQLTPYVQKTMPDGSLAEFRRDPQTGQLDLSSQRMIAEKQQPPRGTWKTATVSVNGKPVEKTWFVYEPTKPGEKPRKPDEIMSVEVYERDRQYSIELPDGTQGTYSPDSETIHTFRTKAGAALARPGTKERREAEERREAAREKPLVPRRFSFQDSKGTIWEGFGLLTPDGTLIVKPEIAEAIKAAAATGEQQEVEVGTTAGEAPEPETPEDRVLSALTAQAQALRPRAEAGDTNAAADLKEVLADMKRHLARRGIKR